MGGKNNLPVVQIVKKILPAMVSITSSKNLNRIITPIPANLSAKKKSEKDFYLNYLEPAANIGKKIKISSGSGFIVEKNGIILTNRHVVEDPKADYFVILHNNKKLRPKILAKNPINDVAVLKIEYSGLPTIELGDSSSLELGEEVIAVGNVLGLFRNTVSRGVISGLSREITAQGSFDSRKTHLRGLIQTDAAINPGNSGGPLINRRGEAIGINAAMIMGTENIGFAIPINNAKRDLEDLKKYGHIRQPFLGLRYVCIDEDLKEKFNLPVEKGALVLPEPGPGGFREAVIPKSPAAKAGVKEGDIIVSVNGKRIGADKLIEDVLQEIKIGEKIMLEIIRGKKKKRLKAILGERK